jgi:HprK-related kinase A
LNLCEFSSSDIRRALKSIGISLQIGPFAFRIISDIESIAQGLFTLYPDYPIAPEGRFIDFTVHISRSGGLRRWIHPQAIFRFEGAEPFTPLPEDHAFPLLEWAMNWCISSQAHHYLMLHSAVIEREGCAVIMPAPPGSGKSTLCAGLVNRGWRLLSDELALIAISDVTITPLGRPISLKNKSIDVIRNYVPDGVFNTVTPNTTKGSVTHLKVPAEQLQRIHEKAQARWVIFPKYVAGSRPSLTELSKANSLLELGRNSFNYLVLGKDGFETLAKVIDASDCYDFQYSQLDDAVRVFDELVVRRNR